MVLSPMLLPMPPMLPPLSMLYATTNNIEIHSTSKPAENEEFSALLNYTQFHKKQHPPQSSQVHCFLPTVHTRCNAPLLHLTKIIIQHTSLGGVMLVLYFSEDEHKLFCSALSEFLQPEDGSSNCGVLLEFLEEQKTRIIRLPNIP
jgi:hypothetical protein